MRQALTFIALGLVAGVLMATLLGHSEPLGRMPDAVVGGRTAPSAAEPLAARIAVLEARLAEEVDRGAALEAKLADLSDALGALRASGVVAEASPRSTGGAADTAAADLPPPELVEARVASRRERASPEYRLSQLVEAGFPPDQAQWIVEREAQVRLELLNAQYESRRQGEPFNPIEQQLASQREIRQQLGDSVYAQYLEATGQPTSVTVRDVIGGSAGEAAGLQRGDEIVAYGGERVFNLLELNELTLGGEPGEAVAIDIVRDGQPMQVYVPRGPIGFAGGGRNFAFGGPAFMP